MYIKSLSTCKVRVSKNMCVHVHHFCPGFEFQRMCFLHTLITDALCQHVATGCTWLITDAVYPAAPAACCAFTYLSTTATWAALALLSHSWSILPWAPSTHLAVLILRSSQPCNQSLYECEPASVQKATALISPLVAGLGSWAQQQQLQEYARPA